MISLNMHYAFSFVLVEHFVCHEGIFALMNVFTFIAWGLLSTLLAPRQIMRELLHWPSIARQLP